MQKKPRKNQDIRLLCTFCGLEIPTGTVYWYCNGTVVCEDCLPCYARQEFAPYCQLRGKEVDL